MGIIFETSCDTHCQDLFQSYKHNDFLCYGYSRNLLRRLYQVFFRPFDCVNRLFLCIRWTMVVGILWMSVVLAITLDRARAAMFIPSSLGQPSELVRSAGTASKNKIDPSVKDKFLVIGGPKKNKTQQNHYAQDCTLPWLTRMQRHHLSVQEQKMLVVPRHRLMNPQAPRGGVLRLGMVWSPFTSVNPANPLQYCAPQVSLWTCDTLMRRAGGEPFTMEPSLVMSYQMPDDRSFVVFRLNPKARFHDGSPVTAMDVMWTCQQLGAYGPIARQKIMQAIKKMTIIDDHTIRFDFMPNPSRVPHSAVSYDQELPLLLGLMPVFSRHSVPPGQSITCVSMKPLISSGPYTIADTGQGRRIVFQRWPDYWNQDNIRGLYNPDTVTIDLFASEDVLFQAFLKGDVDVFHENNWYRWNKIHSFIGTGGTIRAMTREHHNPVGMFGMAFHQRRPWLNDVHIRQGLCLCVQKSDFLAFHEPHIQWTSSFFPRTIFMAHKTITPEEHTVLEQMGIACPMLEDMWAVPDGQRRSQAFALFAKVGWRLRRGRWYTPAGQPVSFRMVVGHDVQQQQVAQTIARAFRRCGVGVTVAVLDDLVLPKTLIEGQYDFAFYRWLHSFSPGIEQMAYYHSQSIGQARGRNYAGVANLEIDRCCEAITQARTYSQLIAYLRILDRLLRAQWIVLPLYHTTREYVAFSSRVGLQDLQTLDLYGIPVEAYWIQPGL